ncbi:hypothetical protein CGRA01v4_12384 [Colletotrichum graminicola]|nr:hypothetical protein CGRA01v4_12384 [Colletotrichum graminicola]
MHFIQILLPLIVIMASATAVPIQPRADVTTRWVHSSPAIASLGDEGPVGSESDQLHQ